MTLKSSVGHVKETGSGTYSWKYRTKPGEKSKIVYVTAKDSHGLKGQIAFSLNVH